MARVFLELVGPTFLVKLLPLNLLSHWLQNFTVIFMAYNLRSRSNFIQFRHKTNRLLYFISGATELEFHLAFICTP